ncbi:hypothetical protein TNIN_53431 [Trichonephila inaurata madagascariensis]|uniref:BTB domain-containing protein n=1 Tax=Trichonephila inaurata madagascariensis TaxID=2747483 RepID=A0A8X7BS94_9ARAC|nr:hypothetical protein TNIN_53431 [Trichonephila inaurata madagascariensis]
MIGDFIGLEYGEKLDFLLWEESVDDKATLNIEVNKADEVVISFDSFCKSMKLFILQLYMTDTNGSKIDCGRHEIFPHEYRKNDICALSCTKNYLRRNEDMRLKSENLSLILECSWSDGFNLNAIEKVYVGFSHVFYKICISNSDKEMADLKKAFENVCAEDILNDVKFRSPTQTFHAHKVILSARSPVFCAMFTTDMKEKIEGCVDVPDLEDDTVHRMLQYVYSNNLEGLHWESAMKLYAAADKYQIVTLKNKCSSFVKRNLCPSNVCEVLCLADMHGDSELKRVAQEYVLAQEEDVFSSDEWSEFAKNYPSLAMDAMLRNGNDQQQLE